MKRAKLHIEGIPGVPYSQSAHHRIPMKDRESHDDYDKRTWLDHCTTTADGQIAIPAMGIKQALDGAAYKLGEKIPGRRGATYKSFFMSGVLVEGDVPISNGKPLTKKDAKPVTINAHVNGKRGSGSRVPRTFPEWPKWQAVAEIIIADDIITEDAFMRHAKAAGMIVGIGRFRPENGGTNGRFRVTKIEWEEVRL